MIYRVVEVYDRDLREFVEVEPEGLQVSWGLNRPARLSRDGVELRERFRVFEVVSAGTDRWLLLEAISGLPALYERPISRNG